MSRKRADHNIYGLGSTTRLVVSETFVPRQRSREAGYTIVALLAVMTVLAMFALAAAPSIQQQTLREREREAIFRGEQVADAIRSYYIYRRATQGTPGDQALPTSIEQLLEGVPVVGGSKKLQILRVSASRDPLTQSGEWGFIRPRSQKLIDFQRSLMLYSGNIIPFPQNAQMAELQRLMAPQITQVLGTETERTTSSAEDVGDESGNPFIGVTSRSRRGAVMFYYGIDHHNDWIFTPLFKP